jgi:hypothetical protein
MIVIIFEGLIDQYEDYQKLLYKRKKSDDNK